MTHSWLIRVTLCVAIVPLGCSRAIKEGVGIVRGGSGITTVIEPISADVTRYGSIELATFDDQTGTGVPAQLQPMLQRFFKEMLVEKKIPRVGHGDRTLTVRGTFLYYERAGRTVSQAVSPIEEVVARVELLEGGKVIAQANCVGRSTATSTYGVKAKAQGLAKAIIDWLEKAYPELPKDESSDGGSSSTRWYSRWH